MPFAAAADEEPATPGTPSQCAARYGVPCYGAPQLQRAYGVDTLHRRGIDGAGETLAVVMPLGNPRVREDLDAYSKASGLPPADLEVIKRGDVRDADPDNPLEAQNVQEANLDLQTMHAIAPSAQLILVSTPENLSTGTKGWRDISNAITWLAANRPVTAINMSYGSYEDNFAEEAGRPGDYHLVAPLRAGFKAAAARGITLTASSGDTGPTGWTLAGDTVYRHPSAQWPASDPLVAGIGGTELHADDAGNRTAPDSLWTDDTGSGFAAGAAYSKIWPGERTVNVSAIASLNSPVWTHSSMNVMPGQKPGWTLLAGTSVSAPLMAGITALAAQRAGHNLGNLVPRLARIRPGTHGTQDVSSGCNTAWQVTGFCARRGVDTASGIGTVTDADAFTAALAG